MFIPYTIIHYDNNSLSNEFNTTNDFHYSHLFCNKANIKILKYYYDRSSIINKINDIFTHAKCYHSIKDCMLYIMANNLNNNPNNIFDTKYCEGKYKEC